MTELETTKKALEMACAELQDKVWICERLLCRKKCTRYGEDQDKCWKEYFLKQAESGE